MKLTITSLLFLAITFPFLSHSQEQSLLKGWEQCALRKSSIPDDKLPSLSPNTPKHKFDVLDYKINIDLYNCFKGTFPNSFRASNIITFKVDTSLNVIQLNADNASLVIDGISLDGTSFTHSNNILTINLNQTYLPGDTAKVRIQYHHLDVSDNAFFASGGFVFTDCEPEKARRWFPCWDKPSDKATLDLTAKVPLNARLGSNGRLQDSLVSGDSLFYHWVSRDPVATYLVVLTGRVNYKLDIVYWTNPSQPSAPPTPIRFYYNSGENPSQMKAIITDVCDYFSYRFGDHPFEKNGFATLNNQFTWGGMENQSLTSLCPNCWYESVVVHEFAHQWFGDMITCGTWADIFINEGFATYLEALWYEYSNNYAAYKAEINADASSYLQGNPGWPIYNPSWAVTTPSSGELFNYAITYAKGACVLHQLRYVMGDSLFFLGLENYATDTVNFKYQNALISDFQEKMQDTYGSSLDWFFDEWIRQPNHPVYDNTYNFVNLGGGSWKVNFFARQTQVNTVFFQMPIEIKVNFTDNSDTLLRVMNDVNNQLFAFNFSKQPSFVSFDPFDQIVLKRDTTIVGIDHVIPGQEGYRLFQNTPNPAAGVTEICYEIPEKANIRFNLYDSEGKLVETLVDKSQAPGNYRVVINSMQYKAGVYFYQLEAGEYTQSRRMIIAR